MREIRTSGSVRGEEGNLLTYSTCGGADVTGGGDGFWACVAGVCRAEYAPASVVGPGGDTRARPLGGAPWSLG